MSLRILYHLVTGSPESITSDREREGRLIQPRKLAEVTRLWTGQKVKKSKGSSPRSHQQEAVARAEEALWESC